jgi:integrase
MGCVNFSAKMRRLFVITTDQELEKAGLRAEEMIGQLIEQGLRPGFQAIPSGCKYVFYRQDKNGYHGLGDFKNAWRRCLKIAGVNNFRFHDTRHCSASALIDNGTPEQVVMSIAGWKTNMLRVYYNREPKKTLDLVRFDRKCDSAVIEPKAEAV